VMQVERNHSAGHGMSFSSICWTASSRFGCYGLSGLACGFRSGGDPVAILRKQKATPKGGFLI
jgi:hypothetical protein